MSDDSVVLGKEGEPSSGTQWSDSAPDISMLEGVRDRIHAHVSADTRVERGGVLVGAIDHRGHRVDVIGSVAATRAVGEVATLTFTHEAWDEIDEIMGREYPDLEIVGWYHSHPHFGVFLSEYDLFIHRNFFSKPWQVAYVEDPLLETTGFFGWERGEIMRLDSWAVRTKGTRGSVGTPDRGESPTPPASGSQSMATSPGRRIPGPPAAAWMIIAIAALMLGLVGGFAAGHGTQTAVTTTPTTLSATPRVTPDTLNVDTQWSFTYRRLPAWISNGYEYALVEIVAVPSTSRHLKPLEGAVKYCGPPGFSGGGQPIGPGVLLVPAQGVADATVRSNPTLGATVAKMIPSTGVLAGTTMLVASARATHGATKGGTTSTTPPIGPQAQCQVPQSKGTAPYFYLFRSPEPSGKYPASSIWSGMKRPQWI